MSFETSNHNEANEAQSNNVSSTNEINQQAKDTIDSVKALDPVKSAEMAASCEAVRLNTAQEHQQIVESCKMDKVALMQDINLFQEASKQSDIPALNTEIETIETRIAELQVDGLTREEKRELYKLNNKRDDLRQQVVILEKQEADEREEIANQKDAENTEKVAENTEQSKEDFAWMKGNIDKFVSIYNSLQSNTAGWLSGDILSVFEEINALSSDVETNHEELRELFFELTETLSEGDNLSLISKSLRKNDEEHGTSSYAEFKSAIISVDSSFASRFQAFEISDDHKNGTTKSVKSLESAQIFSAIPKWSTEIQDSNPDTMSFEEDGAITKIDTSTFPPKRTLSLEGSDYTMETETPMTDWLEEATEEYEGIHEKLDWKINNLSNLIETISSISSTSFEAMKSYLLSSSVLTDAFKSNNPDVVGVIEWATSIENLKGNTLMVLKGLKDKAEKELKDAEDEYKQTLNDHVDSYREMMSEKDERTKEILKTLQDTGFDMLPQQVSDMLIAEIQSGQLILDIDTPFDPGNIDIANGQFGQSEALSGTDDLFIKNIVRFMNKIIWLTPDGKDIDGNLVWLSEESYKIGQAPFTPTELRTKLIDSGILLENGWVNIERARNSLKMDMSETRNSVQ